MSDVFKFLPFDLSAGHGVGGISSFECLNRHLIATHHMGSTSCQLGWVQLTHGIDLLLKCATVFRFGIEPVAVAMGLEGGFL